MINNSFINVTSYSLSDVEKHNINFGISHNIRPNQDLLQTETAIETKYIDFKPHKITLSEFKNIFYTNEFGIYCINEIYKDSKFINFGKQELIDNDSTREIQNLNEYVISAYEDHLGVTRQHINSFVLMTLNKELLQYRSLCDVCNINVFHTYKELETMINNYRMIKSQKRLNFKFIYKNELFKDIEIVFNFNYDVDFS